MAETHVDLYISFGYTAECYNSDTGLRSAQSAAGGALPDSDMDSCDSFT